MAMMALLLAGLRPTYSVEKNSKTIILKTANAIKGQLDSLQKALPGAEMIDLEESAFGSDLNQLFWSQPEIQQLHIVGDGLPDYALDMLSGKSASFYLNEPPAGLRKLNYNKRITVGKNLKLSGEYRHENEAMYRLFIQSPGGKKLIRTFEKAGLYAFEVELPMKEAGQFLFSLLVEDHSGELLAKEDFPVVIDQAQAIRVFLLNQAPTFESKYLKNWLADEGYSVAVRSTISRDKYKTEFLNGSRKNLNRISEDLLDEFDVLLLDVQTLAALSRSEQNQILSAVNQGLGLCLLANTPPKDWSLPSGLKSSINFPLQTGAAGFSVENSFELTKIPFSIAEDFGIFPILQSNSGQTVAAWKILGEGRISLNLIPDTYLLLLDGKAELYHRFWSPIIGTTARQHARKTFWESEGHLCIQPKQPLDLQLTYEGMPPVGQFTNRQDSTAISFYFRQHPFIPGRWTATIWPDSSGWMQVFLKDFPETSEWFYVQEKTAWNTLCTSHQIEKTRIWSLEHPPSDQLQMPVEKESHPVPLWWLYFLFLVAAITLWLEEKL